MGHIGRAFLEILLQTKKTYVSLYVAYVPMWFISYYLAYKQEYRFADPFFFNFET